MGDQRHVGRHGKAEVAHGPGDAQRHDQAGADDRRRRFVAFEQAAGGAISVLLGHGDRCDPTLGKRKVARRERLAHAPFAMHGKGLAVVAIDQRQPPVAELDEQAGRLLEGRLVVDVQIGIGKLQAFRAPVDDVGDAQRGEQRHPPIGRPRRGDVDGIDLLVGDDAPVGGLLLVGRGRAQHQVEVVDPRIVAEARQELDEMRVDVHRGAGRHDIADHPGLAGRQAPGTGVWAIAVPLGCIHDAAPRLLADLRIAVEGAADRGLRQREHGRELFQVHSKALSNLRRRNVHLTSFRPLVKAAAYAALPHNILHCITKSVSKSINTTWRLTSWCWNGHHKHGQSALDFLWDDGRCRRRDGGPACTRLIDREDVR